MGHILAQVIFGVVSPAFFVWYFVPIIIAALKSGKVEGRDRWHDRADEPAGYWFRVGVLISLGAMVFFTAGVLVLG